MFGPGPHAVNFGEKIVMKGSALPPWGAIVLLVVVVGGLAPDPCSAHAAESPTSPAFDPAAFDAFVESVRERYRVPGLAVALVHHDKAVVVSGYGKRRFDAPEPVDADTLFALASVTKAFTAALVATYVDEKKLDWDRPVIEDFPELVFKDRYTTRMATPRDLLAHRTGLPAFVGDLFDRTGYDRAEVIRRLRLVEPACSFREHGNYSNLGYFAAGMLAAKVGASDWETLMHKRLFEPLGMRRATFTYRVDQTSGNVAKSHFAEGDSYDVMDWVPQETLAPAGGLAASIGDMVPFLRVHLAQGKLGDKEIFSAEAIREMHRPAMVDTPGFTSAPPISATAGLAFALGWDSYHYRGYEVIEKGGALGGTRTVVSMIPELGVGVAVFANLNLTLAPEAIRGHVLEHFTGGGKSDLQEKISQTQQKLDAMFAVEPAGAKKPAGPPSRPLASYAGDFTSPLYGRFAVTLKDGGLRWTLGDKGYGGPLAHVGFDTFQMEFPPGTVSLPEPVTFILGEDGSAAAAESELLGRMARDAAK
jgi:CubicO group peptidase (beta-lactamase class C family)